MNLYGIVGAGGFGREVIPLVEAFLQSKQTSEQYKIVFVQEEKPNSLIVNTYPVLSAEEFFAYPAENKYFNIAIANSKIRQRIAEKMREQGIQPFGIRASNSVQLGP